MRSTVLSKKQLSLLIDDCIQDVKGNGGIKVQSLGNLFRTVGMINKDNTIVALSSPLTSAGMVLTWFGISGVMSMLTPDVRQKYEKMLDLSSKELAELLAMLKEELCERRQERAAKVIEIIARLDALWIKLDEEISLLKTHSAESET
ncbi:hypothetical protein [Nitrososphaera sp.]|uniref:hypothetical protein n=1 Tax=Nitrososphaera sp. TaxID=1971748 RepID=UPI00307E65F4